MKTVFRRRARAVGIAALTAALYVVLTLVSAALGLSTMPLQVRLSEILCVLPVFTPAAVPGLAVGCLLANLLTSGNPMDLIFGTLATLLGALGTYALRRHPLLSPLPAVLANTLIVPPVLLFAFGVGDAWWLVVLLVFAGEFMAAGIGGTLLLALLRKTHAERFLSGR